MTRHRRRRALWLGLMPLALVSSISLLSAERQPPAQPGRPRPPAWRPPVMLPGEFVIRTFTTNHYLTARDRRNNVPDAVITTATSIGPAGEERFRLSNLYPNPTVIQTRSEHYLTASGGIRPDNGNPGMALQTYVDSLQNVGTARFKLIPSAHPRQGHTNIARRWPGYFTIQTASGHFLTAVGGGGRATKSFHTDLADPRRASNWERYWVLKCGDLGSDFRYAFRPTGTGPKGEPALGYLLAHVGTGTQRSRDVYPGVYATHFKLSRQPDGSYAMAIPAANKTYYVTAVGGGGLASGKNLQTDATQVGGSERFTIVDTGDCTYTIQTSGGWFVATGPKGGLSTRISDPNAAPSIGYNAKFELIMMSR